jgi:hypothetical protein
VADRLPLLEAAGYDLLAQVEGMLRQARLFQGELERVRELANTGRSDGATRALTEGAAAKRMMQLRRECSTLGETLEVIETALAEERASRA